MKLSMKASHIWKTYDGNRVLKDCSFSIDQPGIYVLTGPNGCGKSTFLRICALIESPDEGAIGFFSDGMELPKDTKLKRRITLVLPRVGIFNTSVFKNAAYGLKLRGVRRNELNDRVLDALEFVGLTDKRHRNALTLSSGEMQRLGIARAMVIEPEILLLDEPTASVDQKNTEIIEGILTKIKEAGKSAVVMTTHDRDQAERLADHPMTIREGKILYNR